MQNLLVHFNIESTIRKKISKLNGKEFESFRLFITDNESVENFKKIGFIIKKKHFGVMDTSYPQYETLMKKILRIILKIKEYSCLFQIKNISLF